MSSGPMTTDDLHPSFRKAYGRLPAFKLDQFWSRQLMNLFQYALFRPVRDDQVDLRTCQVRKESVRIHRPRRKLTGGGLLWIHGGGYVTGKAMQDDAICNRIAKKLGVVVVSVEYRVAPKHPYPAAIDDCFDAWLWFLQNANSLGVDQNRIAVSGQSGGAGLAAALCQRILDSGRTQPIAQCLYCPMLDDRTAARRELDSIEHFGWPNRSNRYGWNAYLGRVYGPDEATPSWAVPGRRQTLAGLPPTWIGIGDADLFYEENLDYAKRLRECNVPCEIEVVEGGPHGFQVLVPEAEISSDFISKADSFLMKALGT